MGNKDRYKNQRKRPRHNDSRQYDRQETAANNTTSNSAPSNSSASNSLEIPGFYYDEVKKRYFKIQPNNQRQANVVTNDTIKHKKQLEEVLSIKYKTKNVLKTLQESELGFNDQITRWYNDFKIRKLEQKVKIDLSSSIRTSIRSAIKYISLFEPSPFCDYTYMLTNSPEYFPSTYSVQFFRVNKNLRDFENDFDLISLNLLGSSSDNSFSIKFTNTFAYVKDNTYLVTSNKTDSTHNLEINSIQYTENKNKLKEEHVIVVPYKEQFRCSALNSSILNNKDLTKCAVGTETGTKVSTISNLNASIFVNTMSSEVFSLSFHPLDFETSIFSGCKNKILFRHDLRQNTKSLGASSIQLRHNSSVIDMKFHNSNTNHLFSTDYTGEVYLWDLRVNKCVNTYKGNINENSHHEIKLSNCSNYLYTVGQDGHTRVWNTRSNSLVQTFLTPKPIVEHQIYADIPHVHLFDNINMLYLINNSLSLYSYL